MNCSNQTRALNFTQRIIQGDKFDKSYTGYEIDTSDNSQLPLDYSNTTIRGSVRPSPESDTVINMTVSTFDSGTGSIDSFRLEINSSDTATMTPGTWVYDVDATSKTDAENVKTLLKGNFIVRGEVTK